MSARFIATILLAELTIAAPLAYWLMWRFAFRGPAAYWIGSSLIVLTFALPVVLGLWFHAQKDKR